MLRDLGFDRDEQAAREDLYPQLDNFRKIVAPDGRESEAEAQEADVVAEESEDPRRTRRSRRRG